MKLYCERVLCWMTSNATKSIDSVEEALDSVRKHEKTHVRINGIFGFSSYIVHAVVIDNNCIGISSRCMRSTPGKFRSIIAHLVNVFYDIADDILSNDAFAFLREIKDIPREMLPPHTIARGKTIDKTLLKHGVADATMIVNKITGIDLADPSIEFKNGKVAEVIDWIAAKRGTMPTRGVNA